MGKIRTRLAIVFITLIGLSVLICGILSAKLLRDSLLDSLQESMNEQLNVILRVVATDMQRFQRLPDVEKLRQLDNAVQAKDTELSWVNRFGQAFGDHLAVQAVRIHENSEPYVILDTSKSSGRAMFISLPLKVNGDLVGHFVLSKSVKQVDASTQRFWNALILGLIIIFFVTSIISLRLAQSITRPIERITRIAEEITSFDFHSRAVEHDRDEIGKLGQAINTMALSLEHQLQQIFDNENRFKTVLDNMITGIILLDAEQRISLLNRQTEHIIDYEPAQWTGQSYKTMKNPVELPTLIERCLQTKEVIREELTIFYPLERIVEINIVPLLLGKQREYRGMIIMIHDISTIRKLEMVRREFVANVSHEIKTPLTALKGFAETLLSGALEDKQTARSFLQIIYNEADRLNRLITDILQLSKMESGQYTLACSPVELKPLIEKLSKMMSTAAAQKSISLQMNVDNAMFIEADEDLLLQILINLTSNAINYTPNGGKVEISASYQQKENEEEQIRIVVSDTGIGIPKQDQQRIFERFYRVDKARSRESGGTGLGLSIVKHLVELHCGTISVDSRPGVGSEFIIDLPLIQDDKSNIKTL